MDSKEVIKINVWGQTAHFRIYGNQNFCDSYPLPPPSTLLGVLREILGERPPEPLTIAIKGNFEGIFFDYRTFLGGTVASDSKKELWIEKIVNRSVETKPLYVKVLYKPCYTVYLYSPEYHNLYLSKLNNPEGFVSLGRSEDLAMIKASSINVERKEARKFDKVKIENSYLPKEVYGAASMFLPICHLNKDRNLKMERLYYIQEAVSYYEGEYWEASDEDRFLWLLEYKDTAEGNFPKVLRNP
ncbi:MAG: CRISPR-associated protein Cas5 [Nitrospirae bacterium]|nr:CRISPR-associated protein Cas5 [Nitrospirota bacterium]